MHGVCVCVAFLVSEAHDLDLDECLQTRISSQPKAHVWWCGKERPFLPFLANQCAQPLPNRRLALWPLRLLRWALLMCVPCTSFWAIYTIILFRSKIILELNETFHRELVPMIFRWFVCIQYQCLSFHLWYMLGGSVRTWMKNNLFRFIGDQIQFSTSWHAKLSLSLNELR